MTNDEIGGGGICHSPRLQSAAFSPIATGLMAECLHVTSLSELDALVGEFVMQEQPEVHWEDSHGTFQFSTEEEARRAIGDPYYQNFLPDVDWGATIVRQVRIFRSYTTDTTAFWHVVTVMAGQAGSLELTRKLGQWWAVFGAGTEAQAHSPQIAVCLAALTAKGIKPVVDHARLEHQFWQFTGATDGGGKAD